MQHLDQARTIPASSMDGARLRRLLSNALEMAQRGEDAHGMDDAWPHGVADDVDDLLQVVEAHDAREGLAFSPVVLTRTRFRDFQQEMLAEHRTIAGLLERLRKRLRAYRLPDHAGVTWRALYGCCHTVEEALMQRMRSEEEQLLKVDLGMPMRARPHA